MLPIRITTAFTIIVVMLVLACGDKSTEPPGNRAPSISSSSTVQAVINQQFSYTATATDPDGTPPTITIDRNPSWTNVSGSSISGTATANTPDTSFRVIASDGELADTAMITVDVVTSQTLVSYSGQIQPILNNSCAGATCHIGGSQPPNLSSYSTLISSGVVIAGNPDGSTIVRRLEGTIMPQMPFQRPPLSASNIQKIRDWIEQGAQNN